MRHAACTRKARTGSPASSPQASVCGAAGLAIAPRPSAAFVPEAPDVEKSSGIGLDRLLKSGNPMCAQNPANSWLEEVKVAHIYSRLHHQRTPLRHAHGATARPSLHSPRFARMASSWRG